MHRTIATAIIAAILGLFTAGVASAGAAATVRAWVSGEVAALILSAVAALAATGFGLLFRRVTRTFTETGEFLTALGSALDDNRITREELAQLVKSGREIFTIWR